MASRLYEILRKDVFSDIETGPRVSYGIQKGVVPDHADRHSCDVVLALTHWGQLTHICISKLTIIGSDNGLSPGRRQAIIWTNAGILLIGFLATNFNDISIAIRKLSFKKSHLKMSSGKWRTICLGLNVLDIWIIVFCYSLAVNKCLGTWDPNDPYWFQVEFRVMDDCIWVQHEHVAQTAQS